jgi:hypothetical protein
MIFARNNLFIVAILRIVAIQKPIFQPNAKLAPPQQQLTCSTWRFPYFSPPFGQALPFGQAFIVGH